MPFKVIFSTYTPARGVQLIQVTKATAAEAWLLVNALEKSDEKVEIRDEHGRFISSRELRERARGETP